jgi:hypothetical protein
MLEIISVSTFAVALAFIAKSHKSGSSKPTRVHSILTVGIQIICGDCSGNDYFPRKTFLDRNGACAQCGGRSYILASTRYSQAQRIMMAHLSNHENAPDGASLKPVESTSPLYTRQTNTVSALDGWTLVTEY